MAAFVLTEALQSVHTVKHYSLCQTVSESTIRSGIEEPRLYTNRCSNPIWNFGGDQFACVSLRQHTPTGSLSVVHQFHPTNSLLHRGTRWSALFSLSTRTVPYHVTTKLIHPAVQMQSFAVARWSDHVLATGVDVDATVRYVIVAVRPTTTPPHHDCITSRPTVLKRGPTAERHDDHAMPVAVTLSGASPPLNTPIRLEFMRGLDVEPWVAWLAGW